MSIIMSIHGYLIADTVETFDELLVSIEAKKILELRDGSICGCVGSESSMLDFQRRYPTEWNDRKLRAISKEALEDGDEIILRKYDSTTWHISQKGISEIAGP